MFVGFLFSFVLGFLICAILCLLLGFYAVTFAAVLPHTSKHHVIKDKLHDIYILMNKNNSKALNKILNNISNYKR